MRPDKARKHDFPNHQQVIERQQERAALKEDGVPNNQPIDRSDLVGEDEEFEPTATQNG